MTTYSTSLKLTLIGDGEQTGTWGSTTNTNFGTLLEQAIVGQTTIVMTNADYTLTNLNGTIDEARSAVIIVTGTQNATYSVIVPAVPKLYMVTNSLTSPQVAYIKMSGGTTTQVPNGQTMYLYCTGVIGASWGVLNYVQNAQNLVTGGTITTGAINCTSLTSTGAIAGSTTITAGTQFSGPGTGITGAAAGLSVGGTSLNVTGIVAVVNGGSGVTTSTGTGNNVLSTSPTLVTPLLGTPTSGNLANCTGYPAGSITGTVNLATQVTGTLAVTNGGTGVTTSTGSGNVVLSTSPTLVSPALGTPTALVGTNITGIAASLTVGNATNAATAATVSTTVASGAVGTTQATATSNTQIATTAFVQAVKQTLYPIGSIYSSTVATNPGDASMLGFGTWIQFAAGRVLVGAGGTFSGTGGSADAVVVSHSHGGVTQSQSANHVHTYNKLESVGSGGNIVISDAGTSWNFGNGNTEANNVGHVHQIDTDGVSGTNANMQPYVVVYMWNRTS
jgi:hypothetical protein